MSIVASRGTRTTSRYGQLVELYVRGINLINLDLFSQSDPQLRLYMRDATAATWVEVGRTETLKNNSNPLWLTTFIIPDQDSTPLRFVVIDIDSENDSLEFHDLIGEMECTLGEIANTGQHQVALPLIYKKDPTKTGRGTVIVTAVTLEGLHLRAVEILSVLKKMSSDTRRRMQLAGSKRAKEVELSGKYMLEWVQNNVLRVGGDAQVAQQVLQQSQMVGFISSALEDFQPTDDLYTIHHSVYREGKRQLLPATSAALIGSTLAHAYVPVAANERVPNKNRVENMLRENLQRTTMDDFIETDTITFRPSVESSGGWPEVITASLRSLVNRLVYPRHQDSSLRGSFLLTFREFSSAEEVLKLLIEKFLNPASVVEQLALRLPAIAKECEAIVAVKVIGFLKTWINNHYLEDFADDAVVMELLNVFIEVTLPQHGSNNWCVALRSSLQLQARLAAEKEAENEKETHDQAPPAESRSPQMSPRARRATALDSSSKPPRLPTRPPLEKAKSEAMISSRQQTQGAPLPLSVSLLLDLDPMEIARAMSVHEHGLYAKIQFSEIFGLRWTKKEKREAHMAPNIMHMIDSFNRFSQAVCLSVLQTTDAVKRVSLITKWIKTAQACAEINNFNGAMEIVSGLHANVVGRLKQTWALVNAQKGVAEAFKTVSHLVASTKNYQALRKAVHAASAPCIPYLGMYLSDVIFICEANPDRIDGLINFKKWSLIGKTLQEIRVFQVTDYEAPSESEASHCVAELLSAEKTDEELYQLSLQIEPRTRPPPDLLHVADENLALQGEVSELKTKVSSLEHDLTVVRTEMERQQIAMAEMRQLITTLLERPPVLSAGSTPRGETARLDSTSTAGGHKTVDSDDSSDDDVVEEGDGSDHFDEAAEIFKVIRQRRSIATSDPSIRGPVTNEPRAPRPLPDGAETERRRRARTSTGAPPLPPRNSQTDGLGSSSSGAAASTPKGTHPREPPSASTMTTLSESPPEDGSVFAKDKFSEFNTFIDDETEGAEEGTFVPDTLPTPSKEAKSGWLDKRGDKVKGWKRRYTVVDSRFLMYYQDPSSGRPINVIPLDGCFVMPAVSLGRPLCFQVHHPVRRTFYFAADTHLDRQAWIEAIRAQIPGGAQPTRAMLEAQGGMWMDDRRTGPGQPYERRSTLSFANPSNAGFLTKQGESTKSWKRRYFVCEAGRLLYYKNPLDMAPHAVIVLDATHTVSDNSDVGKPFCFQLGHPSQRTYYMHADDERQQRQWMSVLRSEIPIAK